jgi:plasmid stabilization system protein ParE
LAARAEADLDAALAWFAEQNATDAGTRWLAQLFAAIDSLESMPLRCPLAAEADELGLEIRELLVGKRQRRYRILFRIQSSTVQVLHVRHAARDQLTIDDLE